MRVIELGGRKLRVLTQANVAHDFWLTRKVREAGIQKLELAPNQTAQDFADVVIDRLMASGMALELLGGLLAPVDLKARDWTPDVAAEMTALVEALTSDEEKVIIRGLVAETILAFFSNGLVSFTTSRTSSMKSHEPGPGALRAPTLPIGAI